mgnify:CR=1 FL=1
MPRNCLCANALCHFCFLRSASFTPGIKRDDTVMSHSVFGSSPMAVQGSSGYDSPRVHNNPIGNKFGPMPPAIITTGNSFTLGGMGVGVLSPAGLAAARGSNGGRQ